MGRKDKIETMKEELSDLFELPKEITLNFPKITMVGDVQVRVENHKGIIEYNNSKIRINTKVGILVITGEDLLIRNIIKEEVVVEGRIFGIALDG